MCALLAISATADVLQLAEGLYAYKTPTGDLGAREPLDTHQVRHLGITEIPIY